jgi:hypothetical protein
MAAREEILIVVPPLNDQASRVFAIAKSPQPPEADTPSPHSQVLTI